MLRRLLFLLAVLGMLAAPAAMRVAAAADMPAAHQGPTTTAGHCDGSVPAPDERETPANDCCAAMCSALEQRMPSADPALQRGAATLFAVQPGNYARIVQELPTPPPRPA